MMQNVLQFQDPNVQIDDVQRAKFQSASPQQRNSNLFVNLKQKFPPIPPVKQNKTSKVSLVVPSLPPLDSRKLKPVRLKETDTNLLINEDMDNNFN